MSTGLTAVVADDSVLLREGLVELLTARGFEVLAQVGTGDDAIRAVAQCKPDVAILDIRMPPTGTDEGLRAADQIAVEDPCVGVLILSEYLEPRYAHRLLKSGAPGRGYLLKQTVTDLDTFTSAVCRVAQGESAVDPIIVKRLLDGTDGNAALAQLSSREIEILALMAEGRTNHRIAEALYLSDRTVESHVRHIMLKLGIPDTADDHRRVLTVVTYLQAARANPVLGR